MATHDMKLSPNGATTGPPPGLHPQIPRHRPQWNGEYSHAIHDIDEDMIGTHRRQGSASRLSPGTPSLPDSNVGGTPPKTPPLSPGGPYLRCITQYPGTGKTHTVFPSPPTDQTYNSNAEVLRSLPQGVGLRRPRRHGESAGKTWSSPSTATKGRSASTRRRRRSGNGLRRHRNSPRPFRQRRGRQKVSISVVSAGPSCRRAQLVGSPERQLLRPPRAGRPAQAGRTGEGEAPYCRTRGSSPSSSEKGASRNRKRLLPTSPPSRKWAPSSTVKSGTTTTCSASCAPPAPRTLQQNHERLRHPAGEQLQVRQIGGHRGHHPGRIQKHSPRIRRRLLVRVLHGLRQDRGRIRAPDPGPDRGKVTVDGPEYETAASPGPTWASSTLWTIEANYYADHYAPDTISLGTGLAFVCECYELGLHQQSTQTDWSCGSVPETSLRELIHRMMDGRDEFAAAVGKGIRK